MIEYTAKFYSLQALYKTIKFFPAQSQVVGSLVIRMIQPTLDGWVSVLRYKDTIKMIKFIPYSFNTLYFYFHYY